MPRTRRQSRLSNDDFTDAIGAGADADASDAVTMAQILRSMQRSQELLFERLSTMPRLSPVEPAAAVASAPAAVASASGNFSRCTARFSGATDEVDGFIDAVGAYKDCAVISDENALRGMAMLLTRDAAVWWQGVRASVSSWRDAIDALRSAFGDRKPPHRIYRLLFETEQQDENTDIFISKARAFLAKLPRGDLSLKVELDITYGLLHKRIRKRVPREDIDSFDELIRRARVVEDAITEGKGAATAAGDDTCRRNSPRFHRKDLAFFRKS